MRHTLLTNSSSRAGCNCNSTEYEWGAIFWQHFKNPSHNTGSVHICLLTNRARIVLTNWVRLGCCLKALSTVLRNNCGTGVRSTICCIATAKTSGVKTDLSEKHISVAASFLRTKNHADPKPWITFFTFTFPLLVLIKCKPTKRSTGDNGGGVACSSRNSATFYITRNVNTW